MLLAQYYRVVWAPGVRSFIAFGEVPTPVQNSVVYLIRASATNGVIRLLAPFKPGDRVQITSETPPRPGARSKRRLRRAEMIGTNERTPQSGQGRSCGRQTMAPNLGTGQINRRLARLLL